MRRERRICDAVYHHLFPEPKSSDPQDFQQHLQRNLVSEVRIETQRFYGSLDTIEARYPGLNYSHPPHRRRLGRFTQHAKLFRAFDELGLTEGEIASLCRWEGTLWARQRYEKDEKTTVVDTTGDEIKPWQGWQARRRPRAAMTRPDKEIKVKTDIEVEIEEVAQVASSASGPSQRPTHESTVEVVEEEDEEDQEMGENEGEDSEEDISSVGVELNQRLIAAAAATQAHGVPTNVGIDPAWDEYFKEAAEASNNSPAFMGDVSSAFVAAHSRHPSLRSTAQVTTAPDNAQ